jgi:hypothetical protein
MQLILHPCSCDHVWNLHLPNVRSFQYCGEPLATLPAEHHPCASCLAPALACSNADAKVSVVVRDAATNSGSAGAGAACVLAGDIRGWHHNSSSQQLLESRGDDH